MNVLYITGTCLTKNTSANMSHNGYVQGLLENGCQVEILMAEDSWGAADNILPVWKQAQYYSYRSVAVQDRIRTKFRGVEPATVNAAAESQDSDTEMKQNTAQSLKRKLRAHLKTAFYKIFPLDPLYPLEKTWLKKAAKFTSATEYDIVISNSSPAASHKLAGLLIKNKKIKCKRWIQIWEDPWYYDLYGGHGDAIRKEEHSLLQEADEIYYVSPLTLKYQQEHFGDCANKMKHVPLPYLDFSNSDDLSSDNWSFGYFGDYYSHTRNLIPFYEALSAAEYTGYIYGDSDLALKATDCISVSGRVTLDILDKVQAKTKVLVHLSNLRGGQIPGKIYHYSATNKPILFILDGTAEERRILRQYFSQFDRFYFCENNSEAISNIMKEICAIKVSYESLPDFSPKNVVARILKDEQ